MTIDKKKLRRCYAATKKYYQNAKEDKDSLDAYWNKMNTARKLAFGNSYPLWVSDAVNIVASRAVFYGDPKQYQTLYNVLEALGCELVEGE